MISFVLLIAILVAHHCVEKHPAHLIMQNFYKPLLQEDDVVPPAILGLTASPIVRARPSDLKYTTKPLLWRVLTNETGL